MTLDLIAHATEAARRDMCCAATTLRAARTASAEAETQLRLAIITWVKIGGSGERGRFADQVGVSRAYMSEICNGNRGIGDNLAQEIAGLSPVPLAEQRNTECKKTAKTVRKRK